MFCNMSLSKVQDYNVTTLSLHFKTTGHYYETLIGEGAKTR